MGEFTGKLYTFRCKGILFIVGFEGLSGLGLQELRKKWICVLGAYLLPMRNVANFIVDFNKSLNSKEFKTINRSHEIK
jgi:hypothetical protein